MTFNGSWNQVVFKAFASLLSENVSMNLHDDRDYIEYGTMNFVVASFFSVFKITKLSPLRLLWKKNAFPFSSSFSFSSKKRTLFTHLCQMCFLYFMFWDWKSNGQYACFSGHSLLWKPETGFKFKPRASGWQWPGLCHVNPHWMTGDSNIAVHGLVRWALFPSQLWLHLKP